MNRLREKEAEWSRRNHEQLNKLADKYLELAQSGYATKVSNSTLPTKKESAEVITFDVNDLKQYDTRILEAKAMDGANTIIEIQEKLKEATHFIELQEKANDSADGVSKGIETLEVELYNVANLVSNIDLELSKRYSDKTAVKNQEGKSNNNKQNMQQTNNKTNTKDGNDMTTYNDYMMEAQQREIDKENTRKLFANTNGVGRLANTLVKETRIHDRSDTQLTSKNNQYLFPAFDRPLLTVKDAPQTLRPVMTVTALEGLMSAPILDYTTEEVAEYEGLSYANLKGDELDFKHIGDRNIAEVSDTIVYCNDVGYLDETIKSILTNQLLDREMRYLTGEYEPSTPGEVDRTHMNLYRTNNPIKQVSGATQVEAITNAVNDLHRSIRPYSTIAISNENYIKLMTELAKVGLGSIDLKAYFGVSEILINPYMKDTVVGNFKGLHANYYAEQFELYSKMKSGVCLFVLAYQYDIQFVPQLFRIAKVG